MVFSMLFLSLLNPRCLRFFWFVILRQVLVSLASLLRMHFRRRAASLGFSWRLYVCSASLQLPAPPSRFFVFFALPVCQLEADSSRSAPLTQLLHSPGLPVPFGGSRSGCVCSQRSRLRSVLLPRAFLCFASFQPSALFLGRLLAFSISFPFPFFFELLPFLPTHFNFRGELFGASSSRFPMFFFEALSGVPFFILSLSLILPSSRFFCSVSWMAMVSPPLIDSEFSMNNGASF